MSSEFTVVFSECSKCDKRMKIAPDGKSAVINVARLADDMPPPAVLDARKAAMRERALRLMECAADASRHGKVNRPLMGWSSWNSFRVNISEEIILGVAKAMVDTGLADAGYRYVNIDDGFFGGRDAEGKLRVHPERFPNGLKPVVDGIHALSLKAGIYSDGGSDTCGSYWDDDVAGIGSGLYGHDRDDCDFFFRDLGFDFIKIDWCGGNRLGLENCRRYSEIRKAIDATGRSDVRMNICCGYFPGEWAANVAESWRTTSDICASWSAVKRIIEENIPIAHYTKPGHYNDMDMLEVGRYRGQVNSVFREREEGLTEEEEITHFGMWCMMSSPLLIGCDVRTIPEKTVKLITNPFLLAMDQNDLGLSARAVKRTGDAYILVKDCEEIGGKARYVALYNGNDDEFEFTLRFFVLDLGGKVAVFDLVERADIGEFEHHMTLRVPAHSTRFFRLDAEERY